jgi:hypothetical protein
MKKDWRQFHKGDLVLTEFGFPAFVYESQRAKDYISIYAFGMCDEWGSEVPEKATRIDRDFFFTACSNRGYKEDYVNQKLKEFKVKI